jgi:hypothetical protein
VSTEQPGAPERAPTRTFALSTTTNRAASLLAKHRPYVSRVRIVRTPGPATVYLDWPESTREPQRAERLFDIARLVDWGLCHGSRVFSSSPEEVLVHECHPDPEQTGPAVEIFIDRRRLGRTEVEVCFDGMDPGPATRKWIIDIMVSASWSIVGGTGE